MGSFRPVAGRQYLHWHFNFTGCYLRTVIVTAAVYWGLSSTLRFPLRLPLTFQHRAGVSSYTSPFGFAETCVFVKQSLGPLLCGLFRGTPSPEVTGSFCLVP